MTLIKYYNPELRFNTFSKVFDQLHNESNLSKSSSVFKPVVDIVESDKNFTIKLSIPGIKKEDVQIELNDNTLIIQGERKSLESDVSVKFHKHQSFYGKFSQSFYLPENINKENIQAKHVDGILSIQLEKIVKKQNKSIIEVK